MGWRGQRKRCAMDGQGAGVRRPDEPAAPAPLKAYKSLRAKGLAATLGLMVFLLGSALFVAHERSKIYDSMQALQQLSRHDKALALAEAAVGSARVDVNLVSNAGNTGTVPPSDLALYMESCSRLFAALEEFDPSYALLERSISRSFSALVDQPVRANWIDLRESLGRAAEVLEIRRQQLALEREALTQANQRQYDAVTIESLLLSLAAIAVFGALVAWFFARLAGDIRSLEAHARHIVHGSRGVMLPVARDDELGRLMQAVNQMSSDLDEREKRIGIETERRAHEDKMLAVASLAAGVAHEVNNPLAAISGMAQALFTEDQAVPSGQVNAAAQAILDQSQRAAMAARNLALLAAPQPSEYDWVDFNALVRKVLQLMGYDKRYRHFRFEQSLAPGLPAVHVPASALQQVLMQLVSLGCEALAVQDAAGASVRVDTRTLTDGVGLDVCVPARLDFALPTVQRVMLLAQSNMESLGGRFHLSQDASPRLTMSLTIPVGRADEQG